MASAAELLKGDIDRYSGVTVPGSSLPDHVAQFVEILKTSLQTWAKDKRRGIWIEIPIHKSTFIPVAVENGFVFHHARPTHVVMTRWLPTDEPSKLPGFMTNYLGVGGLVINDKEEVLVVKEKFFTNAPWKLPGGLADPGEDIGAAAVREVFEETGIRAEFQSVICFRHRHDALFNGSDLYYIARLKPLSHQIELDESEIAEGRWLPVRLCRRQIDRFDPPDFLSQILDYINDPSVSSLNKQVAQIARTNTKVGFATREFLVQPVPSWNGATTHLMYRSSNVDPL